MVTAVLVVLVVFFSAGREEAYDTVISGLLAAAFVVTGALVVAAQPDHRIGRVFLVLGS